MLEIEIHEDAEKNLRLLQLSMKSENAILV